MASDVSQRALFCKLFGVLPTSAPIDQRALRHIADFEAEIRAETALPPILIDPTGKGYPTDERPMTVAEFEAVIRADATAIERERCAKIAGQWPTLPIAAAIRKEPTS